MGPNIWRRRQIDIVPSMMVYPKRSAVRTLTLTSDLVRQYMEGQQRDPGRIRDIDARLLHIIYLNYTSGCIFRPGHGLVDTLIVKTRGIREWDTLADVNSLQTMMASFNAKLNIVGRLQTVSCGGVDSWFWKAKKGDILTWAGMSW